MKLRLSMNRRDASPAAALVPVVLAVATAAGAFGQADEPIAAGQAPAPQARRPLLRDGSHLLRVVGRVQREEAGAWVFVIDPADEQMPGHELIMMPSTLLGEMDRMIESAPDYRLVFELTGEAFVYENRNYLLLSHPPLLLNHEEPPEEPAPDEPSAGEGALGEETGDSVQDIIRGLQRDVGPVGRRPEAEPTEADGDPGARRSLVREGTVLLSRRGKIRRAAGGAYQIVFDADAAGLADPPMTILPCLLLQRIQRYARRTGEDATILISGHVYTYRNQNYLLPTVYRIPRERTILSP